MPIRAVVFDLFDTLVDLPMEKLPPVRFAGRTAPSTSGALHAAVAERYDVPFDAFVEALADADRTWRERLLREGRELPTLERFGHLVARLGLADDELPARLTEIHMGMLAGLVETLPHHPAVLDRLRERVRLGLCSNFSHAPTALAVLEQAALGARLDAVAISHAVGIRKPRREIFEAVLGELGVAPEETLHVGDNLLADVAGAAALGIRTVWLTRRIPDPAAARAAEPTAHPDYIIRDLAELPSILEKLD